jgi:hypothetical protein
MAQSMYLSTPVAVMPQAGSGGQSTMTVIYTDYGNTTVEEAQLSWNGTSWNVTQSSYPTGVQTAPLGSVYTMPSYVAENQGSGGTGEYLAVVQVSSSTPLATNTLINMFYSNTSPGTAPTYTAMSGVTIPGYGNVHAPRLVWLPGVGPLQTVGLLYQAENVLGNEELCWEVMLATSSPPTGWTLSHPSAPEHIGQMPGSQNIYYNSGFSAATVVSSFTSDGYTDNPGTQYLAYLAYTASGPVIETAVYTPGTSASWGDKQMLSTPGANPAPSYVKVTYTAPYTNSSDQQVAYANVFFDNFNSGVLYVDAQTASTPFGTCTTTCYTPAYSLNPVPPMGDTAPSYVNPRLEAPEYVFPPNNGNVPVWLQYQPTTTPPVPTYSLMFWEVPVPSL